MEITRTLQPIVEVMRAAGIVVVAAAGNSGWGCSSVSEPPAIYDAAFTVGATNQNDTIALTSSRGPVTVDGSGRPKPDISAPGVAISSSILIGNPYSYTYSYGTMGGTSMAAPHVAGAVALLWSAVPAFVGQVDDTEHALMWSARPRVNLDCGGAAGGIPNNVYGWGIVDALGAIQKALGYRQHYLPLVLRG